jgi:hypothetical protein
MRVAFSLNPRPGWALQSRDFSARLLFVNRFFHRFFFDANFRIRFALTPSFQGSSRT